MSIIWNDEYDPSELDGFQIETELSEGMDDAEVWLAAQDVPPFEINLDTEGIEPNEVR